MEIQGYESYFENLWIKIEFWDITYKWPDKITPENGKLLATGLPMSKTYKLRFEVLFRPDDSSHYRSIFHVTDGGKHGNTRCGGRIPGIWARNTDPPIRSGLFLKLNYIKISFWNQLKVSYLQLCECKTESLLQNWPRNSI